MKQKKKKEKKKNQQQEQQAQALRRKNHSSNDECMPAMSFCHTCVAANTNAGTLSTLTISPYSTGTGTGTSTSTKATQGETKKLMETKKKRQRIEENEKCSRVV